MNLAATISIYCRDEGYKLHYRTTFQGIPISVENKKGSVRRGVDKYFGPWKTKMLFPYGRIPRTRGMDGMALDVFVGPNKLADTAYIVTIKKLPDFVKDDEQKVFLGFDSAQAAKKAFNQHYDKPEFFGKMISMPMDEFKKKAFATLHGPTKLQADIGEPGAGHDAYSHIQPVPTYHPPSLRNPEHIPVDGPGETDDKFLDVTKRRSRETRDFQDRLTHKTFGTDPRGSVVNTTGIVGFPAVSIGGFG